MNKYVLEELDYCIAWFLSTKSFKNIIERIVALVIWGSLFYITVPIFLYYLYIKYGSATAKKSISSNETETDSSCINKEEYILVKQKRSYGRISGWLILFCIFMVFRLFTSMSYMALPIQMEWYGTLVIMTVSPFMTMLTMLHFFSKSVATKRLYIWTSYILIVSALVYFIEVHEVLRLNKDALTHIGMPFLYEQTRAARGIVIAIIFAIIATVYFNRSKRVEKTFIVKLSDNENSKKMFLSLAWVILLGGLLVLA